MKYILIIQTSILLILTSCSRDSKETTKKGKNLFDNDKYSEAITVLNSAIGMNPNDTIAYFIRGKSYLCQSNFENAKLDFDKVIKMDSTAINPYFFKGRCNLYMGAYNESINDMSTYIKKSHETFKFAYFARGASYFALKNNNKALPDLMKYIELGGEDLQAFLFTGYIKNANGFKEAGLRYISKASSLGNEEARSYLENYKKQHIEFSDAKSLVEERIRERRGSIVDAFTTTAFDSKSYLFLVAYDGEYCNMMVSENALEILAVKCGEKATESFYEAKLLSR